jgi:threonine dehydratase
LITSAEILEAATRVAPYVRHTDLVISEPMSERSGATIAIKAEHQQHTGSFKLRGALNKILTLDGAGPTVGVTAASSGNHGIAVATAAAIKGLPCTVYLPSRVPPTKLAAIRRAGAEIVVVDSTDAAVAEQAARAAATTLTSSPARERSLSRSARTPERQVSTGSTPSSSPSEAGD